MASKISAIMTQIKTDALTTSINAAYLGLIEKATTNLYAEIVAGNAEEEDSVLDNRIRYRRNVTIAIYGKKQEDVDLAIEELTACWYAPAKQIALNALQVIWFKPVNDDPGVDYLASKGPFFGTQVFELYYWIAKS